MVSVDNVSQDPNQPATEKKRMPQMESHYPTNITMPQMNQRLTVKTPIIYQTERAILDIFDLIKSEILKVSTVNNQKFDFTKFETTDQIGPKTLLDLSGLENLTDLDIHQICNLIKKNPNAKNFRFNSIKLNACNYITVWSLYHLSQATGRSILEEIDRPNFLTILERVNGCDQISDSLAFSLNHLNHSHKELSITDTAKVIIINEENSSPCITNMLLKGSSVVKSEFFSYAKLNISGKFLNVYECDEFNSSIFMSERNIVVITFKTSNKEDNIRDLVINRLLMIANKNILPISVMILGYGSTNEAFIKNISLKVKNSIKKLQEQVQAYIDILLKNDNDFQTQIQISNQLNLIEHLKVFEKIINFSSTDLDDKVSLANQINQATVEDLEILMRTKQEEITKYQKDSPSISKQGLTEMKSLKRPPAGVKLVTDSILALFDVKEKTFENFKKLPNLMESLVSKLNDVDSLDNKILKNLAVYVNNPDYNVEKLKGLSNCAAELAQCVTSIYYLAQKKIELKDLDSGPGSSYETLTEYLIKNAYYMFCWPIYYETNLTDLTTIEIINKVKLNSGKISKMDGKKIMSIDAYSEEYNDVIVSDQYLNLSEKYLKAEIAKGNMFMNPSKTHIITDLTWFAKVISKLSDSKTKSGDFDELKYLVGDNVSVWKYKDLEEFLSLDIQKNDAEQVIEILKECSLVKIIEKDKLKLVLPMFLLNNVSPKDLTKVWPNDWTGYEYKLKFDFFSAMSLQSFQQLIKHFIDLNKTKSIWKYGLINNDSGCDILVQYSAKDVEIAVRILDHEKQLNIKNTSYKDFPKFLMKEYFIALTYALNKNFISFKGPYTETHSNEVGQKFNDSNDLISFFDSYFSFNHVFNEVKECNDCNIDESFYHHLIESSKFVYPKFTFENMNNLEGKPKNPSLKYHEIKSLGEFCCFKTEGSMSKCFFNNFEAKLIHSKYSKLRINLNMIIRTKSNVNKMIINLNRYNYNVSSPDTFNILDTIISEDFSKDNKQNDDTISKEDKIIKFSSGDTIKIKYEKKKDIIITVLYNLVRIIQFSIDVDCSVTPELNILRLNEDTRNYVALNRSYLRIDVKDLVGHKLEAIDKLNPTLCCVATLQNYNDGHVLIHFDGWTDKYDYWTTMDDMHLFPAGYMDYINKNNIKVSYRFAKPKGYDGLFTWSDYMKEHQLVPFEAFTEDQRHGMTSSDFHRTGGIIKYSSTECLKNFGNPRVHVSLMDKAFYNSSIKFFEEIIENNNANKTHLNRAAFVLPKSFEESFLEMPNLSFNNYEKNLAIYMPCVNIERPFDKKYMFAHLLDTEGISIQSNLINKNSILLSLITYFAMSNCDNNIMIPFIENTFQSDFINQLKTTLTTLNDRMRKYFSDLFKIFCLTFDLSSLDETLKIDTLLEPKLEEYIYPLMEKKKELLNFKGPVCSYCAVAKESSSSNLTLSMSYKQNNTYSKCCTNLNLLQAEHPKPIELDEKFGEKFSNLRTFICDCKISLKDDEQFLKKLKKLEKLKFSNNGITSLSIAKLKSLETIEISNNDIKFSTLVKSLIKFEHLKEIKLSNIKFDLEKNNIGLIPKSLKNLELKNYNQNFLQFNLTNCELTSLKCMGVGLIQGNSNHQQNFLQLVQAVEFYKGIFTESQLAEIFRFIHEDSTDTLNLDETVKFNAFVFKKFPRIGDDCDTSGIPIAIFNIVTLTVLDLSYQAIKNIPDEIENLVNLKKLILDSCILLTSISPSLAKLHLTYLSVIGCPSLKTPPPEIQQRGMKAILFYLKGLSSGSVSCKRTKLMLVGLGEAGKTSLLNALRNQTEHSNHVPEVTDGINIKDWNIELKDSTTLTYSMWDFAGQSVYYNTHQFFLTSRAVYILVWNVRLGSEYAGLDFWLSSISCHAPGAPIFVVGTHIDQVSTYNLDQENMKAKFPQIAGFYFVSSIQLKGVKELSDQLIETTLQQNYIGEKVPELWINFEKLIKGKSTQTPLLTFNEIIEIAETASLFDIADIRQAIRFLADLGSLQYFETSGLKDRVVINPQWIVDVMACVVSVKKTCVVDGRLFHKDIGEIWSDYTTDLHEWMLKLTEEFDLTFLVPDQKLNIVPCLLPTKEPVYIWPELSKSSRGRNNVKNFQVIYNFAYIPAGLFNRLQVRLFNYADSSTIWKNGSLLDKNNHLALIKQTKSSSIIVKVHGTKPENIIFIIHEVMETLIKESYHGIQYDYSFPCPDCVEEQASDPCMFSSTLLQRCHDYKAPFLQCHKYFHAISIQEMLAIMPTEGISTLDLNLGQSLRDLKMLKSNLKNDIMFWYCKDDVSCGVSPLKVIEQLESTKSYQIWYSKNPQNEKIDKLTSTIKNSKMVILGISTNFCKNEKCMQVYDLVKKIIKCNYLIVEFGELRDHSWLESPAMVAVSSDVRVIMQDPKRFDAKIVEIVSNIERQIYGLTNETKVNTKPPDVFISYCWKNSHDAIKKGSKRSETGLGWLDPRTLVDFFKKNEIEAWLDVEDMNSSNLFGEITKGLNLAKVVIVCFSDDYVESQNCSLEFRFAHVSLKLPIIKAIVGTGNNWKKNEIAFLSGNYPEINFQYKTEEAHSRLLEVVKAALDEIKQNETSAQNDAKSDKAEREKAEIDNTSAAFQELFELTQRKFLSQLIKLAHKNQTSRKCPRLFCIELVENHKIEALKNLALESKKANDEIQPETNNNENNQPIKKENNRPLSSRQQSVISTEMVPCIKSMCESEDGWHLSSALVPLKEIPLQYCSFLSRIMNILKNGSISNSMNIFSSSQGAKLISEIESKSSSGEKELADSYITLRNFFVEAIDNDQCYTLESFNKNGNEEMNEMGLTRCELKNRKVLWLCDDHVEKMDVKILSDSGKEIQDETNHHFYKILEEMENLNLKDYESIC